MYSDVLRIPQMLIRSAGSFAGLPPYAYLKLRASKRRAVPLKPNDNKDTQRLQAIVEICRTFTDDVVQGRNVIRKIPRVTTSVTKPKEKKIKEYLESPEILAELQQLHESLGAAIFKNTVRTMYSEDGPKIYSIMRRVMHIPKPSSPAKQKQYKAPKLKQPKRPAFVFQQVEKTAVKSPAPQKSPYEIAISSLQQARDNFLWAQPKIIYEYAQRIVSFSLAIEVLNDPHSTTTQFNYSARLALIAPSAR